MYVQPSITVGPSRGTESVAFPQTSGGTSPGAGEGLRADWQVRINLSHSRGFVGGAGRLLIHNEAAAELSELVFLMPAAIPQHPGSLRLLTATICSAKPGMAAAAGQHLVIQSQGARALVTVPVLRLNDWMYIDLTWDGGFPEKAAHPYFAGAGVKLGDFHPQVAVDTKIEGRAALAPLSSRYEVTLGTDVGAVVRLEAEGGVTARTSDDGQTTEHEFRSFGAPRILATVFPAGSASA